LIVIVGLACFVRLVAIAPSYLHRPCPRDQAVADAFDALLDAYAAHPLDHCPTAAELLPDLIDPWGNPYDLRCDDRELLVHTRGEDGISGTADDRWSDRGR
jgi:hypothetical protein